LQQKGGEFSVSLDGEHWVEIPKEDGVWVKTASKVQDSVYAEKHKRISESFKPSEDSTKLLSVVGPA
jgi:hypothetical protein